MSYMVRAAPPDHYAWLVSRVGYSPTAGVRMIEALDPQGEIRGMAALDNWMPNSAELHFAADTPIACRPLAREVFEWVFRQAGREYLIALTPAQARSTALEFGRRVGFREIHRLPNGFAPGDDLVYSVLHRDDCRWFRKDTHGVPSR